MWEYSHKRLKLAQLLGRHGVFLTSTAGSSTAAAAATPAAPVFSWPIHIPSASELRCDILRRGAWTRVTLGQC
jgi:hypothetical protein